MCQKAVNKPVLMLVSLYFSCMECGLEPETLDHYLLRCPQFTLPRITMLRNLIDLLPELIMTLNDNHLVQLMTHGSEQLAVEVNYDILKIVNIFILKTNRF